MNKKNCFVLIYNILLRAVCDGFDINVLAHVNYGEKPKKKHQKGKKMTKFTFNKY